MSRSTVIIFIGIVTALGVKADCDKKHVKKIDELWESDHPYDILPKMVGTWTNLYIPSSLINEIDELKCVLTVLDKDEASTVDNYYFRNSSKIPYSIYNMVEEQKGVVTLVDNNWYDDYMYVVYLHKGVMGYYQCGVGYDPFISIAVLDYQRGDKETDTSISEAKERLEKLDIKFEIKLNTDCAEEDD